MRRNVLLVDDDQDIRELVTFFLQQYGFAVRCVGDGHSALEELRDNPFDLVILDISMPHLNGFTVLKSIRGMPGFADLPVILLTGSTDRADVLKGRQYSATDYVIKPPQKEDLVARVERILGGKPQFTEAHLDFEDQFRRASFVTDVEIKSLSVSGMVILSKFPVSKGEVLKDLSARLFQELKIAPKDYPVVDCVPCDDGYEYYISFLGMNPQDQQKIRQWVVERVFFEKMHHAKVS